VLRELGAPASSFIPHPPSLPSLWQFFHDPAFGFVGSPQAESRRPVLIFDQFEEIFTLGDAKRRDDARSFLESLACLVENRPPAAIRQAMEQDDELADRLLLAPHPCRVLLTLRDDFLHRLERWRRQMPSMMDNRLELRLLSGPQAFRAVYEAGARRTVIADQASEIQDPKSRIQNLKSPIVPADTARAIVRFVAGAAPDEPLDEIDNVPPLLSLICEQLNARRIASGQDTIQAEALAQSAPKVLREFYTGCFAPHPPAVRDFVEDGLVSESGFRESVTLDTAIAELARAGVSEPENVLRTLVDQRLLVIDERGGISRVEFTHDILAPIAAASRAERKAREAGEEAERRFAEQRRKTRVRAMLIGVMAGLTIFAFVGLFFAQKKAVEAETAKGVALEKRVEAEQQTKLAKEANKQNLALLHRASMADTASAVKAWQEDHQAILAGTRAESIGGASKWDEAVAYFARALELEPGNPRAAYWLYSILFHRGHEKWILPVHELRHQALVLAASFSPDGSKVVTASGDHTARIWNLAATDEHSQDAQVTPAVLDWARKVAGLRFSEDGDLQVIPLADRQATRAAPKLSAGRWADLATWLTTRGPNRKLSPKSPHTLREIAERERDFGSRESLEPALQYDSTVPLARLMLAGVLEKENAEKKEADREASVPVRVAFLRRYDLDHLSADAALWARAAEILRQTPDAKVGIGPRATTAREAALQAARKAVALDPQMPAAQAVLKALETPSPPQPKP
jgi:tetratricopeptide (TPR) repeat protein